MYNAVDARNGCLLSSSYGRGRLDQADCDGGQAVVFEQCCYLCMKSSSSLLGHHSNLNIFIPNAIVL